MLIGMLIIELEILLYDLFILQKIRFELIFSGHEPDRLTNYRTFASVKLKVLMQNLCNLMGV